jgi:DNA-binding beta-propeller fold protein YncE
MRTISLILKDAYRVLRAYADPIMTHALQVYQSVLATGPSCILLEYMQCKRNMAPLLVSQRPSGWSPVVQVIEGHTDDVNSVAYSPDGAHIVSGSRDRTVRVWDAQTGKELAVLKGHSNEVNSVAFSPDGAHIASGSFDKTVRVWDAQTGKELAVLEGHSDWVSSVAFSPDGAHIVSASSDETVRVWDAQTGKELAVLEGHSSDVISKITRCWRAGEAGPARQLNLPASSPARPRQLASRQLPPNCDHPKTKFVFRKRMYS